MIIQTLFPVKPVFIFHEIFETFSTGKISSEIHYTVPAALQRRIPVLFPVNRQSRSGNGLQAKFRLAAVPRRFPAETFPGRESFFFPFLLPVFPLPPLLRPSKKQPAGCFSWSFLIRCRWKESVRCCHSAAAEEENPDDRLPSSVLLPEHKWNGI